jgi:hypothetical protein
MVTPKDDKCNVSASAPKAVGRDGAQRRYSLATAQQWSLIAWLPGLLSPVTRPLVTSQTGDSRD